MRMLTIGETARRLNLAVDTIRRLERDGMLRAERTAGGHRRFREDVVEAYARGQKPTGRRSNTSRSRRRPPRQPVAVRPATIFEDPLDEEDSLLDEDGYLDDPSDGEDDVDDAPTMPHLVAVPPRPSRPLFRFEVPTMKQPTKAAEESTRLKRYKAHGVSRIPFDVPANWRGKVIAELDTFVAASRFPDWVSDAEAMRIVSGHVHDILKPQRAEAEREAKQAALRAERAAEEATRQKLIEDGMWHARMSTMNGWDDTPAEEAREAVEEALTAEVTPNWSQRRVRERVDEILAEWDDAED